MSYHIYITCLWPGGGVGYKSAKQETADRVCISASVCVNQLDFLREILGQFPAMFVPTKHVSFPKMAASQKSSAQDGIFNIFKCDSSGYFHQDVDSFPAASVVTLPGI